MSKTKIMSAGGIGESRTFNNPETAGEPHSMEKYHFNGVLISEMKLDPHVLSALDYWCTDEGIAEKNARPEVREPSGITVGRDDFSQACDQRRHEIKDRDFPDYVARNPLKELRDRHIGAGMRGRFLSKDTLQDGGSGDWEIVNYPEGHKKAGDPVMAKGMVLAQMPTDRAVARNRHFLDRGGQLLKVIEQKHKAEGGSVDSDDK